MKEFQINIFSLSNKLHEFDFEITEALFSSKENSIVEKGEGKCLLKLQKSETMMNLHFVIDVKVELICDRSLDPFWKDLSIEEDIIIKFGDDDYALSEDVFVIRKDSPSINVGDFIYEFMSLAVPMKKLHPRFDEDDNDEPEIIYSSQEEAEEEDNSEAVDPRWEALKKLKD